MSRAAWWGWLLLACMAGSCADVRARGQEIMAQRRAAGVPGARIVRVRGCEYLYAEGGYSPGIAHAGDCDNPIHALRLADGTP